MEGGGSANTTSKTFFLNEKQELSSFDREGGGRPAQYVGIDWQQRSMDLAQSFDRAIKPPPRTRDPVSSRHHFVVAVPVPAVEKYSQSKQAAAQGGKRSETPTFSGEQSKLFRKMGMDLIETLSGGMAAVHVPATRAQQLLATMQSLPTATEREKSRWIYLERFLPLDWSTRVDRDWLDALVPGEPVEASVRFQPTLSRLEVEDVLRAITSMLDRRRTRLVKAGREFSGRYFCSGVLTKEQIAGVAREFSSVQSIHPRLLVPLAATTRRGKKGSRAGAPKAATSTTWSALRPSQLPTVAIVDTGIPEAHAHLAPYRRAGYRNPDIDPTVSFMGDHGSTVASCAVFGRVEMDTGLAGPPPGMCQVMDVMVAYDAAHIDEDALIPALEAVAGTAPDVRVINLSFDGDPLDAFSAVLRRERLLRLQNLDNLTFARDTLLVVAAGNTPAGLAPNKPYPNHLDDPRWSLGPIARSFNGLVCGAYVDRIGDGAVAGIHGAPSPFTRIGPGLCESPVPGFSAPGGDVSSDYGQAPGTGVWRQGSGHARPVDCGRIAWARPTRRPSSHGKRHGLFKS